MVQVDKSNRLLILIKQAERQFSYEKEPMLNIEKYVADHLIANDVVPVVRCQDCQYSYWEKESETSSALKCGNPNGLFDEVDFNDFCSYGYKE